MAYGQNELSSDPLIVLLCVAISSYIVCFYIFQHRTNSQHKMLKTIIALCVCISAMLVLQVFGQEGHMEEDMLVFFIRSVQNA